MTKSSIREYTEAVRGRYAKGSRKEKGRIWDEFVQVTGYHRKAAIRVLNEGRGAIGRASVEVVLASMQMRRPKP